jgi:Fe-S-cluster containining protein
MSTSADLPILPTVAEEEFLCIRCSRHMKTCCQTSEVYITPGDVRRVAEHVGHTTFYHFQRPEDPVYLQQDDDPIWPQLVFKDEHATRRVLKRRPDGDCIFLGSAGCELPLETRPLLCRLYPFLFNEQGIYDYLAEGCPSELLRPGQKLDDALAMNRADAERWHAMLYRELPEELTSNDYRPDL